MTYMSTSNVASVLLVSISGIASSSSRVLHSGVTPPMSSNQHLFSIFSNHPPVIITNGSREPIRGRRSSHIDETIVLSYVYCENVFYISQFLVNLLYFFPR